MNHISYMHQNVDTYIYRDDLVVLPAASHLLDRFEVMTVSTMTTTISCRQQTTRHIL